MSVNAWVWVIGLALALPLLVIALKRARSLKERELARRIAAGELTSGVPANWLSPSSDRLLWSGALTVSPDHRLRFEPDRASIRTRRGELHEWPLDAVELHETRDAKAFTGERFTRVSLRVEGETIADFVVFTPLGAWRQDLKLNQA